MGSTSVILRPGGLLLVISALVVLSGCSKTQTDERTLLQPIDWMGTGMPIYAHFEQIAEMGELNTDSPNTTVVYENSEQGISLRLPFNENWGTEKFRISPFVRSSRGVAFGPLEGCEGGGLCRLYALLFLPPQSKEELQAELEGQGSIELKKIGNLDIMELRTVGYCTYLQVYTFGVKNNFLLTACEDQFTDEHFPKILGSLRFI